MGWVLESFDNTHAESGQLVTEQSLPPLKLLGQRMLPKEHLPSMTGSVAVDIDETVGALIVMGEDVHVGKECFVRGVGGFHKHVWFLDRVLPGRIQVAAVFASLEPGTYTLDIEGQEQLGRVTIVAGQVKTLTVSQLEVSV
ncbi:hypothetical protein [Ferrimicrobium sp.]|uniref:hypothetical protein n=1 Tax=Ferrimicrobium sp. TaxID=2926050 RepID=UPI0026254420|nr:hypothetical protein [Ferrimicrobium sp.]